MNMERKKGKSAPASPTPRDRNGSEGQMRRKASAMVEKVLKHMESKMESADFKASVADYLRLLQFHKEIRDDEQPKEIRVTWVEPAAGEKEREK